MVLWIVFAILTALALGAVMWPALRSGAAREGGSDVAVYRDQLKELEAELARGQIGKAEGKAARIEISRRLLAAGEAEALEAKADKSNAAHEGDLKILGAAALTLPALAVAAYLALGSPGLPGAPHAERLAQVEAEARGAQAISRLVAQVEARLREEPQDGRGWEVIAPVYARLGRYGDAAEAYERAGALLGKSAQRLEGYGEARALADNGIVGDQSKRAFEAALKLDKTLAKSRFWLGVALEQDGRTQDALAAWRVLLAEAEAEAPWRGFVEERIARVSGQAPAPNKPRPQPGPDAQDIEAAGRMEAGDRAQMINAMVERLANRLAQNGDDLEGWLRLTRSYMVIGNRDGAAKALKTARGTFASEAEALAKLDALARELGL